MKHSAPWWHTSDPRAFGRAVHDLRKSKGWTQLELADRLEVSRSTVIRLESGKDASLATALAALRELGYAAIAAPRFARVTAELDDE